MEGYMTDWSRRDVLKTGIVLQGAALFPAKTLGETAAAAVPAGLREHLLLDFGWRFHFGHATDAAKDFGFNSGRNGSFQKTGNFLPWRRCLTTTLAGVTSICPMTG